MPSDEILKQDRNTCHGKLFHAAPLVFHYSMRQCCIKDPKAIVCIVLASLGLASVIIFFTIGTVIYVQTNPKVVNYAISTCLVNSSSVKTYECATRNSRYTCYGGLWEAHHGDNYTVFATVEEDNRYRDYANALTRSQEFKNGSTYSCWYDTRNPSVAQWEQPSVIAAIALLSAGGASVLITGVFTFLSVKFVKNEIQKKRREEAENFQSAAVAYTN
ncbi:hypothetical protein I4U23_022627 [Adineta vaga]|nr:hypothetical protein I4U23_022627 [Adineta vaga]